MPSRGVIAVFKINGKKHSIEGDTIVNIKMNAGHEYKEVRVTGISKMHDALRVVSDDGVSEIPINLIKSITDAGKTKFPGVIIG